MPSPKDVISTGPSAGNIPGWYCEVSGIVNGSPDVRLLFGRGLTLRKGGNSGTSNIGDVPRYMLNWLSVGGVGYVKKGSSVA